MAVAGKRSFAHVNLSDTKIQDATYIVFNCAEIDLRRTRVAVQSLKTTSNVRILISSDQFPPSQLASLPMENIHVDEDSSFPKW
jgi:hypothetical protein